MGPHLEGPNLPGVWRLWLLLGLVMNELNLRSFDKCQDLSPPRVNQMDLVEEEFVDAGAPTDLAIPFLDTDGTDLYHMMPKHEIDRRKSPW